MGCALLKKSAKTAAPQKLDERIEKPNIIQSVYIPERPKTGFDFRKVSVYIKVKDSLKVIKEVPSELEVSPQKRPSFNNNFSLNESSK